MPIVDASSSLGQWPFRPSWLSQPEALVAAAREGDIAACLVAPVAALMLDDPWATNEALYRIAARWDELRPVAMWNPSMPGHGRVLDAAKDAAAAAVKLAPSYHHYALDPDALAPALDALEGSGMVACIQLRVEDIAAKVRTDRLLFAAHMPFFYPEANLFKLVEADLADDVREAFLTRNACELFGVCEAAR